MTVQQASEAWGVSERTLRARLRVRAPELKSGRDWQIPARYRDRLMAAGKRGWPKGRRRSQPGGSE